MGCHMVFVKVIRTISMFPWPKITYLAWLQRFQGITPVSKFTGCYEVVHKASSSIQEVLYCSSRSFIHFKWRRGKKLTDLVRISMFLDNPSSNPKTELRNEAQRFDGHKAHAHYFSWSSLNFQCHVGETRSVGQLQLSNLSDVPFYRAYANDLWLSLFTAQMRFFFRSHVLFATHHPLCNTNGLLAGYFPCLQHIWQ